MPKKKPKPTGAWTVWPPEWPEYPGQTKPRRRVRVELVFNGEVQFTTHGRVAWLNCQDLAARYNRQGITARPTPPKVLADYPTEAARARAARAADRRNDRL